MNRTSRFSDYEPVRLPKLAWLELTEIVLSIAFDLFTISKRLNHSSILDWLGVRLLRFATSALGHAPAQQYLEFRADLPVQI